MEYHELRDYDGPLTACAACSRVFEPGEVIMLADNGNVATCYSDSVVGCMWRYMCMRSQPMRMFISNPYIYRRRIDSGRERQPHPWWKIWA